MNKKFIFIIMFILILIMAVLCYFVFSSNSLEKSSSIGATKSKYIVFEKDGISFASNSLKSESNKIITSKIPKIKLSNSDAPVSTPVSDTLYAFEDRILDLSSYTKNGNFYLKKVTSYTEYAFFKENIPNLRELSEKDFENYTLLIIFNPEANCDYAYSLNNFSVNPEDSSTLNVELTQNKRNFELKASPIASGLFIVYGNNYDFSVNNIKIISTQ